MCFLLRFVCKDLPVCYGVYLCGSGVSLLLRINEFISVKALGREVLTGMNIICNY